MVCSGQSRSSTTNGGENILCVVASRGDGVVMLSISLGSVAFLSRHVSPHLLLRAKRAVEDPRRRRGLKVGDINLALLRVGPAVTWLLLKGNHLRFILAHFLPASARWTPTSKAEKRRG